jgi:hypothetical protein
MVNWPSRIYCGDSESSAVKVKLVLVYVLMFARIAGALRGGGCVI